MKPPISELGGLNKSNKHFQKLHDLLALMLKVLSFLAHLKDNRTFRKHKSSQSFSENTYAYLCYLKNRVHISIIW